MTLIISDSFTDSLGKLTNQEQAAVKQTAFDLQVDPSNPGLSFHRVDRAKDKDFWTVRVNRDIRIVVHKRGGSMLLAYVDHHDDAYKWAERRRLEVHPRTGAAQIVEIRERVENIVVKRIVEEAVRKPALLAAETDEALLDCGVPEDWFDDVRRATEDTILDVAGFLPAEASEAILNLAVGIRPETPAVVPVENPFEHPDAQRRFRTLENQDELRHAMDEPWEKWTVFLHPAQREFVTRNFNGPARVIGSAGTGKTVVALHRAVRLAREGGRVLLTTFNEALARALKTKLARLLGNDKSLPGTIVIQNMLSTGIELYEANIGDVSLAGAGQVGKFLEEALAASETPLSVGFVNDEWNLIIDGRNVRSSEDYATVSRTGRRVRMASSKRDATWGVFEAMRKRLDDANLKTRAGMFYELADVFRDGTEAPFDHVIVDEAQDVSEAELTCLAAIAGDRPNGLFFAGDIGQRIFRPAFSWKSVGVEIQGRSRSLKVNYRTSHQIRKTTDVLLPEKLTEVDGQEENRTGVVSVFEGPDPTIRAFDDPDIESDAVSNWLSQRCGDDIQPHEIGVIVRSVEQFERAIQAIENAGHTHHELSGMSASVHGKIGLATMHLAKGLEFRAVVVMACDDGIVPFEDRIQSARDEVALEEVFATERHLLYVACTRARDHLLVTGVEPVSEFLDDLVR
ncbi:UvrD-helicase domain-containing protein [Aliiruegeria lutimaris]|uniref:DNA 3'-5' helicase n=1 Tax=Aliiruegeria lutimaris TaxID=571298 RepID=A0A1G9KEA9_9RHOB|nr:UvrD-helicase domain-containing protein [Aliiruegeria lutimaris]SDL48067.1 UvrD/REP helicase N-terminal domain-containing protein [Aliiruegeria lutimaris]